MSTRDRTLPRGLPLVVACVLFAGPAPPRQGSKMTWDFEKDAPGKIAEGFRAEVGTWEVAEDGGNRVLHQKAKNEDAAFNVALVPRARFRDMDLSVRLKAVAG